MTFPLAPRRRYRDYQAQLQQPGLHRYSSAHGGAVWTATRHEATALWWLRLSQEKASRRAGEKAATGNALLNALL